MYIPDCRYLQQTNDLDYFHWNYQFPIKYIQRYRFKAILNFIGDSIFDKLLEIGTGSGIFLPELYKHCNELYACDIHDNMDAVRRLCNFTSTKVELDCCSIGNTNYSDNFFDAVVAVSVLEFVDNLNLTINEIKRILKPNGIFLTICPKQNEILDFILGFYTRKTPEEEFRESRKIVGPTLESCFSVVEKKVFPPFLDKLFPIYYSYRLKQ